MRGYQKLKRNAEQGSQQLRGEVLELELENLLKAKFPHDTIAPVPKGEFGGDVKQVVMSAQGMRGGVILWESKHMKALASTFTNMQEDLEKEKKAIGKQWVKRQAQIEQMTQTSIHFYGEVQGILGKSLAEIEELDFPALEDSLGDNASEKSV
jgi:hypothetical protein